MQRRLDRIGGLLLVVTVLAVALVVIGAVLLRRTH
jgi:hypothetical protein